MYEEEEEDATFITFLEDHRRAPPSPDQGKSVYSRRYHAPIAKLKEETKVEIVNSLTKQLNGGGGGGGGVVNPTFNRYKSHKNDIYLGLLRIITVRTHTPI